MTLPGQRLQRPSVSGSRPWGGTHLSDMRNNYSTLALRKRFVIPQQIIDEEFELEITFDDGFCAYLNGQELARPNCGNPGEDVAWDATATDSTDIGHSKIVVPIPQEMLAVGDNVIAILGLNQTVGGADFAIVPQITFRPSSSIFTSETTVRLQGEAPVEVATLAVKINGQAATPFTPTWTTVLAWEADFPLEEPTSTLEIIGLDGLGQILGSGAFTVVTTAPRSLPGDCNTDGALDLSDVICLLGFLFQNNPATLPCTSGAANLALMDCNGDGSVDLSDAIYKLAFLFQGGPPPLQGVNCLLIPDCPQNPGCP